EGALWIEDLGSRNGSSVDGTPVQGARELPLGALVRLGEVELRTELLSTDDAELAVPAAPAPARSVHASAATDAGAGPTLVSAGLTRFCVRELEPLLDRLARGSDPADFAAAVLRALADSQPEAGFALHRYGAAGEAVLARAGSGGGEQLRLRRGALELRIRCDGGEPQPALQTLGKLGLALVEAAAPGGRAGGAPRTQDAAPPAGPDTASPGLREIYWQAARVARSRLNV